VGGYVKPAVRILSGIVGLVSVISLIVAGISYSTSAGDPQKAAKAKSQITKTVVALFAYLFLFGFLNFLVPGGIQ
jgi:hypothetical protein